MELVGLTAIFWNRVELLWYLIYTGLLPEAPRTKVDQIYQYFINGAAKREFTLHLAEVTFPDEQFEWAKRLANRTGELAGLRNAVVHADYRFDVLNGPVGLKISPSGSHNRRPNRLAGYKDIIPEVESITEQIAEHADELDEFRGYLAQNTPGDGPMLPYPEKSLESMPAYIRNSLPREMREAIALRTFPKKPAKQTRQKR